MLSRTGRLFAVLISHYANTVPHNYRKRPIFRLFSSPSDSKPNMDSSSGKHSKYEFNKMYEDIEKTMMQRINESNTRRFRFVLLSTILTVLWVVSVFGEKIRNTLAKETADLAKETLDNESLKIQTQELAMAVVQTVLNDKEITSHAASFLREASVVPETQQALLQLTLHVLNHPETLKELTVLGKRLVSDLLNDQATIDQFALLLSESLKDPVIYAATSKLLTDLSEDPAIVEILSTLIAKIASNENVISAVRSLLMHSSTAVLQDAKVVETGKDFVADVMGDAALQKEGGNALWNSVTHALKPGLARVAGLVTMAVSFAAIKVLLSPY